MCESGDLRVIGINTTEIKAGLLEICIEGQWINVCHEGWDDNAATVACRQVLNEATGTPHGDIDM